MKTVLALNNQFPTEENKKYGLTSAVSYYRQVMPGRYLDGFDFHHLGHKLTDLQPQTAEETVGNLVKDHDIVFSKHLDNPSGIYMLLGACDYYKKPLIVDFDDDVFATDGKEHNKYVYPEGSEARHYAETFIREATAITVSTEPLLEVYRAYNKNVFLCPNAVDARDWEKPNKKPNNRIKVGWAASTGHIVDHAIFEPVMETLVGKRPEVVFSMLGHYTPDWFSIPEKNWEILPGIHYWDGHPNSTRTYPKVLLEANYDIGVAPLVDSRYNAARSLAKWFEYTMTGVPMIASEYGPYPALKDTDEAYLVQSSNGWVHAIEYLIDNPHERERLVENSRAHIEREYTIQHALPAWAVVFSAFSGFRK